MSYPIVTNQINDPSGVGINGPVTIQLIVPGFDDQGNEIASTPLTVPCDNGVWSTPLKPNSLITPSGTYYTVTQPDGTKWTIVVPNGAGPYSLQSILTASPAQPGNQATVLSGQYLRYDTNAQGLTGTQQTNAQTNLGLGSAALQPASAFDAAGAASAESARAIAAEALALKSANNLSDLASVVAARSALGLGSAALQNTTAFDAAGAAASEQTRALAAEALLIPRSWIGIANGVVPTDSGNKIPVSYLPASVMEYLGTWNPVSNTPTLVDGTGQAGQMYRASVAGSHDFGHGSITFQAGDHAIYNASGQWERGSAPDGVSTVAGRLGDVVLTHSDITDWATATIAESQVTSLTTDLAARALILVPTATKTSAYTAAVNDLVLADATSGAFAVTLPTAPADKSILEVKKLDSSANAVTVTCGGSDTFAIGGTTLALSLQGHAVRVQYQASTSKWIALDNDLPLAATDARYAPIASPTFTGTPAAPTAAPGTNTTQLATTAFVQAAASGIPASTVTTKGDLIAGTGSATVTRLGAGADGKILTVDSSQSSGLGWITHGRYPQPASGESFSTPFANGNSSNFTMAVNTVYYMPVPISVACTLNALKIVIDTTVATSVVRLGVYTSDANNRPKTLLLDAGTVSGSASTGLVSVTISQAVSPGLLWFCAVSQTASAKVRCTNSIIGISNISATANDLSAPNCVFLTTGVSGALASNPTLSYSGAGSNQMPIIIGTVA